MPWQPLSVSPTATWLSTLSLLVPLSIFLATIELNYQERRWLSLIVIAVALVSIFLGLEPGRPRSLKPLALLRLHQSK